MTKRERLLAAVEGRRPDRTPVSFWRHFPRIDHDPELLAEAMIEFQEQFDLDLVKLMPSGMYGAEDYGCEVGDPDPTTGAKRLLASPVDGQQGWAALERPLPPEQGARGRELVCLRLVRRALNHEVAVLQTIFSPSTTAAKAAGRDRWIALLRSDPNSAHRILSQVARSERAFVAACLDAGADGVFFATQLAGDGLLAWDEYSTLCLPHDLVALEPLRGRPHLSIAHIHGERPLFDLARFYTLPMVSWHDRRTSPDLCEGLTRTGSGAAAGGLDERGVLSDGPAERIGEDVRDTLDRVRGCSSGPRHMLAPGCVLPLQVPDAHLLAARSAVEESG
ncbi:MAG: hypothetical protein FJX73_02325 [Armatimonadetes bacterium]|nr:hypothetical protein [Armatimonadota bacterium]